MAKYNVFVPAKKGSEMPDLTIKVEASNWLVALKESLRQIGEQGDSLANIVCETAEDGSLRVADPAGKRVFLIRQVAQMEEDKLVAEAERRAAESRRLAEMAAAAKLETENRLKELETKAAPPAAAAAEAPKTDELKKLENERRKLEAELAAARVKLEAAANKAAEEATGVLGKVEVERTEKKSGKAAAKDEWGDLDDWYDGVDAKEETIDDVVSDIFLATEDLHEKEEKEAAQIVLDLATQHVSAEAASVFFSDINSALKDLVIAIASGPIGKKIVGIRVPLGKGIVGFSVVNGVKLIVNQVDKNPNFYGKLDQEFGFKTRSILCVPIQHEDRTYGAIELINKKGEEKQWTTNDANIMESLAKILGRAVDTKVQAR